MKLFKQREFLAIPVTIVIMGILFILFAAFQTGLWAWLLAGAVGVAVCTAIVLAYARRHRHAGGVPPVMRREREGSVHRILVVADDACGPEALRTATVERARGRAVEALVIAPAVGSRLSRWTSDQADYDRATEHLEATLLALEEIGVAAHGRVGSKDPIQAADDGLREFPADEIVLAVHGDQEARWLEGDAVEVARGRYDVPVTPIVLERS
jgi:hypothetical protein